MRAGGRRWRSGLRLWRRGAPLLLRRRLLRWRTPLWRRAVWARARGRRGVTRRAERIETFGRTSLVARWLGRSVRWLGRRGTPRGCGWRLLIAAPLLRGRLFRLLRWRRVVGLRWRRVVRLRRRCAPLRRGRRLRCGWSVVLRRGRGRTWWWGSCTRWRRCQGRAAGETKFAGGLVAGAAPRADDHEPYSRNLRHPVNQGVARGRQHTRFRAKRREIARGCGTATGSMGGRGAVISSREGPTWLHRFDGPLRLSDLFRRRRGRLCP
jgi:hypothetical protein